MKAMLFAYLAIIGYAVYGIVGMLDKIEANMKASHPYIQNR